VHWVSLQLGFHVGHENRRENLTTAWVHFTSPWNAALIKWFLWLLIKNSRYYKIYLSRSNVQVLESPRSSLVASTHPPTLQSHIRRGEIIDALKELFAEEHMVRQAEKHSEELNLVNNRTITLEDADDIGGDDEDGVGQGNLLHSLSNDIMVRTCNIYYCGEFKLRKNHWCMLYWCIFMAFSRCFHFSEMANKDEIFISMECSWSYKKIKLI